VSHLVDILLTTYNGDKYLHEQIGSLFVQTFTDWRLIVRDDGSNDKTLTILKGYQHANPLKITVLDDSLGRLGPAKSFEVLARESSAPYLAFCDQDDIWMQDKLLLQIEVMQKMEKKQGGLWPILIHTDLYVIDKNKKFLDDSFWNYQNLNPQVMNKLSRLLVQNYVTGCTVLINRTLLELALPIPCQAVMHDWWLALMAMSEGRIISLGEKTVKYRQHDRNDIGAMKWSVAYILQMIFLDQKMIKLSLSKTWNQASALLASGRLNNGSKKVVEQYVEMFGLNWFRKRMLMIRMGFIKYGRVRNLAIFIFI
jgi:glycosyltransferase involved in cell wall biosynthesis